MIPIPVNTGGGHGVGVGIGGGFVGVGVGGFSTVNNTDDSPLPIESWTVTVYTPVPKVVGMVDVITLVVTSIICKGTPTVRVIEVVKFSPLTTTCPPVP